MLLHRNPTGPYAPCGGIADSSEPVRHLCNLIDTTISLLELPETLEKLREGVLGAKVHVDPWAAPNRRPPTALVSSAQ
jgi:hypothetical protein